MFLSSSLKVGRRRRRKREKRARRSDRLIKRRARAFIITVTMCVRAYWEEEEMISWGKSRHFNARVTVVYARKE